MSDVPTLNTDPIPFPPAESRRSPRLSVPAMYSLLRARPAGDDRYRWTGYVYDVSRTGMRFELDQPVEPGTRLEVRAMLPGHTHTTFKATGTVVRIHDDLDTPGPIRMGMHFDSFATQRDEKRIDHYLNDAGLRAAA